METSHDGDQKSGIFFIFFFFSRGSTVPFLMDVCSLHWMSPWICHLTCFFVILSCRQQMRRHRQSLWMMMMMVVALFRCVPQIDIRYIHIYVHSYPEDDGAFLLCLLVLSFTTVPHSLFSICCRALLYLHPSWRPFDVNNNIILQKTDYIVRQQQQE